MTFAPLCDASARPLLLSFSFSVSVSLALHVSGLLVVTFHTFCFMLSGLSIILPYFTIVAVVFKPALIYDHASVCATPPPSPSPTARILPATHTLQSLPPSPPAPVVVVLDINYAKCCLHL